MGLVEVVGAAELGSSISSGTSSATADPGGSVEDPSGTSADEDLVAPIVGAGDTKRADGSPASGLHMTERWAAEVRANDGPARGGEGAATRVGDACLVPAAVDTGRECPPGGFFTGSEGDAGAGCAGESASRLPSVAPSSCMK